MEAEKRLAWGTMATDFQERINMDRMRRDRLAKTRDKLKEKGIAAALLTGDNMRYATGVRGGIALVFAEGQDTIIFNFPEYAEQRRIHCPWIRPENVRPFPVIEPQGGQAALDDMVALGVKLILPDLKKAKVEKEQIAIEVPELRNGFINAGINVVPIGMTMLEAREIKTDDEINCMKMVGVLADTAWTKVIENIRPGITDCELGAVATSYLLSKGAEAPRTVMKSGPLSAPNAGMQTDRIMQTGDIGFGVIEGSIYLGYNCCSQRTWVVGTRPTQKQKDWYKKCYDWITVAQDVIKPGITTADVAKVFPTCDAIGLSNEWEVCSNIIAHGSGVGFHDIPHITRAWSLKYPLPIRKGQTIALHVWYGEKGIGGARIENVGVVTDNGWENFYTIPYDGIIVPPYQVVTAC